MCIVIGTIPLGQFIYGFVFEHIGNFTYAPFYMAALIMIVLVFLVEVFFMKLNNLWNNKNLYRKI